MAYCNRMNRPCTCNKLSVYQRDGRVLDLGHRVACLTDNEVRAITCVLQEESRRRFSGAEPGASRLYA